MVKEDKKIFELSEVFKNMESKIIENYNKLKDIQASVGVDKANKSMQEGADAAAKYNDALKGVNDSLNLINSSDDNNSEEKQEVSGPGYSVTVETNSADDASLNEDDLELDYFKKTIAELKKAAYDAAISGDIKLAYKIERAIDEIIEVRDEDK